MIDKIEALEKIGIRVSIHPQKLSSGWCWVAGIYVNDDTKAIWIDSSNGLPKAAYKSYSDAYNAVIDYCENSKKFKGAKL